MTEHDNIQAAIVESVRWYMKVMWPGLPPIISIPNGDLRNMGVAVRLKKTGVWPGVFDLFLAVPRSGSHGLWVEIKRPAKNDKLRDTQERWAEWMHSQGYTVRIARSCDEGFKIVKNYLEGDAR